ncbi:MAG: tetratricopeptide repeat protein, partial [Nitrospirota bacterium]
MINKSKVIKDAQKFVAKAQWDKAIIEYEKIIAESPSDGNTFNTVGDLCLKRNDTEKAIESCKKAAELFNKTGFTLKAIALYKKVLNIKPDQVDIFILMGKLNAERGMLGNANENYLAAASYFTKQGQKVKAIDIYKTLCELNPDNFSLAQKLAELYLSEGFEKEGINKCIELAEKKLDKGDSAGAMDFLAKVEKKSAERFDFIRVSALIDIKDNRLQEATAKLEKVNKVDPNDVRVLTPLAEAYLRSGRYEESAAIYRNLHEKDPQNIHCQLQLIDICLKTGDYASAWKEYSTLAYWHISRKEFAQAEKFLREFLTHKKDSMDAMKLLADVLEKQDRREEAESIRRQVEVQSTMKTEPPAPAPSAEEVRDSITIDKEISVDDGAETNPLEEKISTENPVAAEKEISVDSPSAEEISLGAADQLASAAAPETIPSSLEEETLPEASLPDLPEGLGDFPQMEPGDDLAEMPQDFGTDSFPEGDELEGIDIFALDKGLD